MPQNKNTESPPLDCSDSQCYNPPVVMPPHTTLYIVMPCYNEQAVLVDTVNMVIGKLQQLQDSAKIAADSAMLFSDDGSKGRHLADYRIRA